ncbi:putative inorganic phosphate cotransporter [Photinus pyralis]|nr:putative inorganic phosphate cotransporter [Photinus pyralis]XP_031359041.1 putative inorganic phosphate cotransporter [Photinus pyralis]
MEDEVNVKLDAGWEPYVTPPRGWGTRHSQILLLFLLPLLAYGMRVNMSVGIVAMTDPVASLNPDVPTYEWSDQGVILSSFFMGYFIPQAPAGLLAKNYGPKWIIAGSFAVNSLMVVLVPIVAPLGSWAVIVCRALQGLGQGFIYPCIHQTLSKWAPPLERARFVTFVYSGANLGTVISMSFTGWISETWVGWPWAFYVYGAAGLLWTGVWIVFGRSSPAEHDTIVPLEKQYIEVSLGEIGCARSPPTPWKAIFTSMPFWAVLIAQFGQAWGFTILITNIPTYMSNVLGFDIKKNGALSAGPYFAFWIFSLLSGVISDYVVSREYVTVGFARKFANTIALCVPGIGLIVLGVIGNAQWDITDAAVILLFISVGFNGSSTCGYHMNHIDLSPVHSGTLMGIASGSTNFLCLFAPLLLQFIVTDEKDAFQWATVFYITSAIYLIGNTVFVVFGSGETQPWNNVEEDDENS